MLWCCAGLPSGLACALCVVRLIRSLLSSGAISHFRLVDVIVPVHVLLCAQSRQHSVLEHAERELESLVRSQRAAQDALDEAQRSLDDNKRNTEETNSEIALVSTHTHLSRHVIPCAEAV